MARTIVIEQTGGPEKLKLVERELAEPDEGEIMIRHKAIGLNYIDTYQRSGLYKLDLPHALGMEGAGVIEKVGPGVTHLKEGDRAAYAATPPGAYAEARVMPATTVCRLPDAISFEQGAAMMLQGLTVEYLFHRIVPIARGDTILFHAAAGGVGLIACGWARSEGIEMIGTAGSDEKCALARQEGAAHVINYRTDDFVAGVRRITGGKGVKVVMDGVGADTFEGSLDCLRPVGMMISFGNASGPVPPVSLLDLSARGSLQITRPTLFTFLADFETGQEMAKHLFSKVLDGDVKVNIGQSYALEDVADAHRAMEARETTGSTILTV